jgi:hypothetical protein
MWIIVKKYSRLDALKSVRRDLQAIYSDPTDKPILFEDHIKALVEVRKLNLDERNLDMTWEVVECV